MKFLQGHKLFAVRERMALAVNRIVERHRSNGRILTWRLIHEIEQEALQTLTRAGDLDARYIRMVSSSRWGYVPRVDEPADLDTPDELPIALTMIRQAYRSLH
jgi:hypothetical protein